MNATAHAAAAMATVHRKSAKGVAEIETRAHRLPPRLRGLLIMVDGQRSDDELGRLMPDAPAVLAQLAEGGFIEAVARQAGPAASAQPAPPATPTARPRAAPAPAAAAPAAPTAAASTGDLDATRRAAVRQLTDLVGPMGEALALRMEKARSLDELRPLLVTGAQIIANTRGRQAALDFAARFGVA